MFVECRSHSSTEIRSRHSGRLCWLLIVLLMVCFTVPLSVKADDVNTKRTPAKIFQVDFDNDQGERETDEDEDEEEDEDEDEYDDEYDEDDEDEEGSDDILGAQSTESLPSVSGGRFNIPAIAAVSTATADIGNGSTPDGFRVDSPRPIAPLPELANDRRIIGQDSGLDASWNWSVTRWDAANTYSNPRYFEDVMLERHGHERWGHLQPLASGMRFFTTIPMLPYKMAIKPPCDCEYTMGYYRTGSCAPALYQRPPWDRKAILAESAAVATGMIVIP